MADGSTQQRSGDYIGGVMMVVVNPRTNCAIEERKKERKKINNKNDTGEILFHQYHQHRHTIHS